MSDEPPISRKDIWVDTVLNKLDQIGALGKQKGVTAILDGGDFFHVKSPSRNSHSMVQRVIDQQKRWGIPVLANVGNHDVKFGDLRYLQESPLGVLFNAHVFQPCYNEKEFFISHVTNEITRLPPQNGPYMRIVGVPYHGTIYNKQLLTIAKGQETHLIVMAHMLASEQGGTMFEGEDIIPYSFLSECDADLFLFGHWHKDQGIYRFESGKQIVNTGSLTRGSLSQDEVNRTPSVVTLSIPENGEILCQQHFLQVKPSIEVFNLEQKKNQEFREDNLNRFLSTLTQMSLGTAEQSLEERVSSLDLTEEIRKQVQFYLEQSISV